MARSVGPACKLCRREGIKLYLKGDRCYLAKCPFEKRSYAPGEHGKRPPKISEYGRRLREKQKAKRVYGLSERQFKNYFLKASKEKGITGEKLLQLMERRLDNVVFRLALASSRRLGGQLVRHGHIKVNERKVNIPSYQTKVGDLISVRSKSANLFKNNLEKAGERTPPAWLSIDKEKLEGKVLALPERSEIDTPVEEHLIVEFYSR